MKRDNSQYQHLHFVMSKNHGKANSSSVQFHIAYLRLVLVTEVHRSEWQGVPWLLPDVQCPVGPQQRWGHRNHLPGSRHVEMLLREMLTFPSCFTMYWMLVDFTGLWKQLHLNRWHIRRPLAFCHVGQVLGTNRHCKIMSHEFIHTFYHWAPKVLPFTYCVISSSVISITAIFTSCLLFIWVSYMRIPGQWERMVATPLALLWPCPHAHIPQWCAFSQWTAMQPSFTCPAFYYILHPLKMQDDHCLHPPMVLPGLFVCLIYQDSSCGSTPSLAGDVLVSVLWSSF